MSSVSGGTLSNWLKAGADTHGALTLDALKATRLTRGANKTMSLRKSIPKTVLGDTDFVTIVSFVDFVEKHNLSSKDAVLLAVVLDATKRGVLLAELPSALREAVTPETITLVATSARDLIIPGVVDAVGVLYEAILFEKDKNIGGVYYTPEKIIMKAVSELNYDNVTDTTKICDPFSGSGRYLIFMVQKLKELGVKVSPSMFWAGDIDPVALLIAQYNIFLLSKFYGDPNIVLNAVEMNSLAAVSSVGDFKLDIVVTNPPWGAKLSKREWGPSGQLGISYNYETFAVGVHNILAWLKDGGQFTVTLPESVTNVVRHQNIREHILINDQLLSIRHYCGAFDKVMTPAVQLTGIKGNGFPGNKVSLSTDKVSLVHPGLLSSDRTILQGEYLEAVNNNFYLFASDETMKLISSLKKSPHVFYLNTENTSWGLGIVTGDNKKFLTDKVNRLPVLTGKNITEPYRVNRLSSTRFLNGKFDDMRQKAPLGLYKRTKIVYNFIGKKLMFCVDDKGTLTLNSCNFLIPETDNLLYVAAVLNSDIYQRMYYTIFNQPLKHVKGSISQVPLLKSSTFSVADYEKILELMKVLVSESDAATRVDAEKELNTIISKGYRRISGVMGEET